MYKPEDQNNKKFNFNIDDFDMDLFDLDRSKSILIAFDELFPLLSLALKVESNYYQELYPYAFSYYQIKKSYLEQKEQSLIASSLAFKDVKEQMKTDFLNKEAALKKNTSNIDLEIQRLEKVNLPLDIFILNDENNYLDTTDL